MDVKGFLKPSLVKAYLTVVFTIPLFTLALAFMMKAQLMGAGICSAALIVAVICLPATYLLSCAFSLIYGRTQNKWLKMLLIAAATLASLGAALILFLFVYSQTMVCDPVHKPPPQICDPVHRPNDAVTYYAGIFGAAPAVSQSVRKRYQELIEKLK